MCIITINFKLKVQPQPPTHHPLFDLCVCVCVCGGAQILKCTMKIPLRPNSIPFQTETV